MSSQIFGRPTRAEINLKNLADNFRAVKDFTGSKVLYMAVVKADAYGHGAVSCSRALEAAGVDWFGVALPEEGVELRKNGISKPILCLGGFWDGQEELLCEHDLTPVIFQTEKARILNEQAKRLKKRIAAHIKIDTGMGRIGARFEKAEEFAAQLSSFENISFEGIMTHFAAADSSSEKSFTRLQIERFAAAVDCFEKRGFNFLYKDLANSPASVAYPEAYGNMIRLGGILYGLGDDVLPDWVERPVIKPVLSLHTEISLLKHIKKGETLGYGRTFRAARDSLIATVPIGYEDGYRRALSNRGRAIVNGGFADVVGRISMDWTILDVTDIPDVRIGDRVILIGESGESRITAEELAAEVETISYEITCGINRRVGRVYVGSE